jgi:hypothetical protein
MHSSSKKLPLDQLVSRQRKVRQCLLCQLRHVRQLQLRNQRQHNKRQLSQQLLLESKLTSIRESQGASRNGAPFL